MGKTADRARLVMVLEVQGVPAIVVDHESLPFVDFGTKLRELPAPRRELSLRTVVHINTDKRSIVGISWGGVKVTYNSKWKIMLNSPLSAPTALINSFRSSTQGISPTLNASYSFKIEPRPFRYSCRRGPQA